LELTYLKARELGRQYPRSDIERTIFSYSQAVMQIFGLEETKIIDILHPRRVHELGIRSQGETMEIGDRPLAVIPDRCPRSVAPAPGSQAAVS
jgi:hypothetical protein